MKFPLIYFRTEKKNHVSLKLKNCRKVIFSWKVKNDSCSATSKPRYMVRSSHRWYVCFSNRFLQKLQGYPTIYGSPTLPPSTTLVYHGFPSKYQLYIFIPKRTACVGIACNIIPHSINTLKNWKVKERAIFIINVYLLFETIKNLFNFQKLIQKITIKTALKAWL